ncbi:6,7-dimethyl-8-ribityllumazine synthase [Rubritalea marina]|uniref:6,7-dimethyl-8-ribityllumazine synthase n=1 Tax=Rubritalea marina TaxID=361055 RepID=UPI000376CE0E|nr:6,7-dimethyl-8-ribityllumazine synthase [Rubritalea marina]
MSTALPPRPQNTSSSKANITIVASIYNNQFTDALVENAKNEIATIIPGASITIARVPGAFEIPVTAAAVLASDNKPDALITLGLIIRGKTQHGDLVAESVTNSLQQLACESKIPVIHEVLLVDDDEQAYARCIGDQLNRGREAARSAYAMIELFTQLGFHQEKNKKPIRSYPSNA